MWNVSLPAATGCSASLLYLSDLQGQVRGRSMCVWLWFRGSSCLLYIHLKACLLLWECVYHWSPVCELFLQLLKAVIEQHMQPSMLLVTFTPVLL